MAVTFWSVNLFIVVQNVLAFMYSAYWVGVVLLFVATCMKPCLTKCQLTVSGT